MTTQEPPTSLRLVALRKDLESGSSAALDSFWNEIATSGTPLVEPIKSDDHHMMVTFLWRARGETNNVAVIGGPTVGWLPPKDSAQDKAMIRLLDTDVWYKTYRVRTDARVAYLLSPNDPLLTPDQVRIDDAPQAQRQPDPFNPRCFFYPQDPEGPKISTGVVSMVELPDAPPQPFVRPLPGVPTGKVEVYRLKSNMWTLDGDTEPEGLARRFASSQKVPLHFYLEVGLLERVPAPNDGLSLLTANRHMRDVLIAKDYPVHYSEFNGRHEFANWQGGLSNGLLALLGKDKAQSHH